MYMYVTECLVKAQPSHMLWTGGCPLDLTYPTNSYMHMASRLHTLIYLYGHGISEGHNSLV